MDEKVIAQLCNECFGAEPESVERCAVGLANFVYIVECEHQKITIRCSAEKDAYKNTIYWLERLGQINVPVPAVLGHGEYQEYAYLMLSYLEGRDLGLVYPQLTKGEKRIIAKEIVEIQNRVATLLLENVDENWSWESFIQYMLNRAKERITANGYFDPKKVEQLKEQAVKLYTYFSDVQPIAYLDDISTKNLLIHNGRISGIIDIDWMGIGDKLTFVALTNVALLNMECDADYVDLILEEMQISETEKQAFLFYSLMYCVDFMGERGMQFMDKKIEVNDAVISRLNGIYERLWSEFITYVNYLQNY